MSNESGIQFRQAGLEDLAIVSQILTEACDWTADQGLALWDRTQFEESRLRSSVEAGEFHLVYFDERDAGVFKILYRDEEIWPDALEGEALYLHKVAVRRVFSGKGIVSAIVKFAHQLAKSSQMQFVRLDCETRRPALRKLYLKEGFTWVSDFQFGELWISKFEYPVEANNKPLPLIHPRERSPIKHALVFGGTPSTKESLYEWERYEVPGKLKVWVFERPRYGIGDQSNDFRTWVDIVQAHLVENSITEFSVIAISGGGPFGLAAASHDCCRKLLLVSAVGDTSRYLSSPKLSDRMRDTFVLVSMNNQKELAAKLSKTMDREAFHSSVFRKGFDVIAEELIQVLSDWDLDFGGIRCPVVAHHAIDDDISPYGCVEALGSKLSDFSMIKYSGGHRFFKDPDVMKNIVSQCM